MHYQDARADLRRYLRWQTVVALPFYPVISGGLVASDTFISPLIVALYTIAEGRTDAAQDEALDELHRRVQDVTAAAVLIPRRIDDLEAAGERTRRDPAVRRLIRLLQVILRLRGTADSAFDSVGVPAGTSESTAFRDFVEALQNFSGELEASGHAD